MPTTGGYPYPVRVNAWLWGFLIGSSLGASGGSLAWLTPVGLAIGVACCGAGYWFQYTRTPAIALAGALWAAAHGPGTGRLGEGPAVIVRRNPILGLGDRAIIGQSGRNGVGRADDPAGTAGTLRIREGHQLLGRRIVHFRSDTSPAKASRLGVSRHLLSEALRPLPPRTRSWVRCVALGDFDAGSRDIWEAMCGLGLAHILVVSGLHVSFLGAVARWLLEGPLHALAALRWLSPVTLLFAAAVTRMVTPLATLSYGLMVGLTFPVQRAVLHALVGLFAGRRLTMRDRLRLALCLQTAFFPIGILTTSFVLSWYSFLIVVSIARRPSLGAVVGGQVAMTALVGALVGRFSPVGIAVNLVTGPFHGLLFLLTAGTLGRTLAGLTPGGESELLANLLTVALTAEAWFQRWAPPLDFSGRPLGVGGLLAIAVWGGVWAWRRLEAQERGP